MRAALDHRSRRQMRTASVERCGSTSRSPERSIPRFGRVEFLSAMRHRLEAMTAANEHVGPTKQPAPRQPGAKRIPRHKTTAQLSY